MVRLWIVCFLLLFGIAEGYQWVTQLHWFGEISLSLPLMIAGGAALAIASNYSKFSGLPFDSPSDRTNQSQATDPATPLHSPSSAQSAQKPLSFHIKRSRPKFTSISFEIPRSKSQKIDSESQ